MEAINQPKLSDTVSEFLVGFIFENGLNHGDKLASNNELTTILALAEPAYVKEFGNFRLSAF